MSEWIEWKGGKQPVADHVLVDYVMRNETLDPGDSLPARELRWEHEGGETDITAYRIVNAAPQTAAMKVEVKKLTRRAVWQDLRLAEKERRITALEAQLESLRTAQRIESVSVDFDAMTWTFQIAPDCRVSAGIYALVRVGAVELREGEK